MSARKLKFLRYVARYFTLCCVFSVNSFTLRRVQFALRNASGVNRPLALNLSWRGRGRGRGRGIERERERERGREREREKEGGRPQATVLNGTIGAINKAQSIQNGRKPHSTIH